MTIVFFTRRFYPSVGGVENHVLHLSIELIKKGHKIVVITEKFDALKEKDSIYGVSIYRIPVQKEGWFKKFHIWKWLLKHRDLIKNADVIHAHDVFFWYLPFRFLYPRKRVFVTFHGYETRFPPSRKAMLVRKISEKFSRGNICVGEFIRKWYGTNPDYLTYGGVDKYKAQNSKLKTQSYNSKVKILFVGRLEKDMGIPIYLETLKMLKNNGIKFEFEACGDGSLRRKVEKYGKVQGFLRNIDQYFANADIVFTSSYLSILEAFLHKKPVFAVYDNSLKKDYLEMSPFVKWITIENNPKSLADKLDDLLNNSTTLNKMIYKSHNWVRKQTWRKVAEMYIRLWSIDASVLRSRVAITT